jgi:hypothetical protein
MSKYKSLVRTIKEHNTPVDLNEVQDKEVKMMKSLSKDMQKVLKGYQQIVKAGDKTLSDKQFNYEYETILQARDTIIQLIGRLETKMITQKKMRGEEVEVIDEKLNAFNSSYQRVSKYNGKEFDRKKEIKQLDKMHKALEQVDKLHADLQYPYVVDTVTRIWDHLMNASIGIMQYKQAVKDGEYDGIIDKDA